MQIVLVLDDDAGSMDLFVAYLETMFGNSVTVLTARDPVEAATRLAGVDLTTLGCVISDVQQPMHADWAFIDQLLLVGRVPKAKIVSVSGADVYAEADKRGITFLAKPMHLQEFMTVVKLACLWPHNPE